MLLLTGSASWLESVGQLISVLVIFVVVLLLTYLTTKWIAGYQKSQINNRNLRVVETLKLTANKYIQIVEAGDVYLVIALSKDRVEKLAELRADQLKEISASDMTGQNDATDSFREILERVRGHFPKK